MNQLPRVVLLMRKEHPGYYSIERLFHALLPAQSEHFDVKIVNVPCHGAGLLQCVRNLLFTARLRADIIHVTGDIHYCALAIPRQRCVLTIQDLVSLTRMEGIRRRAFSLFWYSLPLRWASRVTAASEETRRQLVSEFPKGGRKVEVIPACVDEAFGRHHRAPNTDTVSPQVLQMGTGTNKNLERVAVAASDLPLRLRIIGPLSEAERERLGSLNLAWTSVEQISDEQMVKEYRDSDILVFASTYEGFGLPIVEAQAIGLPVITSDVAPMSDVAGDGALLVDPYDVTQIHAALEQLLGSPSLARKLSDRGKRNADRFGATTVANKYAEVYARVLARAGPHD
jgi:glycosyltransferase involved in cell wall biosynthesis